MKKNRKSLNAVLAFLLLTSVFLSTTLYSAPLPVKPQRIIDDETVYALLEPDGKPSKTIVIDWLRLEGKGLLEVIDHGEVKNVEALKDNVKPELIKDDIIWKIQVDDEKDFYYRAETEKELPVDLNISYFLDNEKFPPEKIAGRDGRLKIELTVKNKIKKKVKVSYLSSDEESYKEEVEEIYLPLMVIVNLDLKAAKFSNIETKNSMLSVSGGTMKYTWMIFPQPEATATIEMDGKDIETSPLIVSVIPKMPDAPSIELEEDFKKMKEGMERLGLLSSVQAKILKGLSEKFDPSQFEEFSSATSGLTLLYNGIKKTREGTDKLSDLMSVQLTMLQAIINGIDTGQFESLAELASALQNLLSGLESSQEGIDGLIDLLQGQISVLEGLKESNDNLISLAEETTSTELINGLKAQSQTIESLINGGDIPGQGDLLGLKDVKSNLENISRGLNELINGLQAISEQAVTLNQIPEAFKNFKSSLETLKNGGNLNSNYLPGLKFTLEGLKGISNGLEKMEKGLSGMNSKMNKLGNVSDLMTEFKEVLNALAEGGGFRGHHLPGLNTVGNALKQTSGGLGKGLEEMRKGKAIKEAMENEAENYDTFLGKPDGAQGRVRFIIKISGIEK